MAERLWELELKSALNLEIYQFNLFLYRFVPHKEEENKPPGLLKDDLQYGKVLQISDTAKLNFYYFCSSIFINKILEALTRFPELLGVCAAFRFAVTYIHLL